MLAGALPRIASALGQPAVLAAGVAAGVAVGAVGIGTGAIPVTDPPPHLASLYECPGAGRVVVNLPPDQQVLVTARSADGTWLEIFIGQPGVERAWARAGLLSLRSAPDSLPVADCATTLTPAPLTAPPTVPASPSGTEPSGSGVPPSGVPATLGTPTPSSTPTPTSTPTVTKTPKPTKTPTPTATPLTGPVLSHLDVYSSAADTDGVWRIASGCSDYPDYFAWTLDAADPDTTVSVRQYYRPLGDPTLYGEMVQEDSYGELWDGGFSAHAEWQVGPIEVWFQGRDADGNLGPIFYPASEGFEFEITACKP